MICQAVEAHQESVQAEWAAPYSHEPSETESDSFLRLRILIDSDNDRLTADSSIHAW